MCRTCVLYIMCHIFIIPYYDLFLCDIQVCVIRMEINQPVEINHYDTTMVNHYDITMDNDVAMDIHCDVTRRNDVTMCINHDITMYNDVTMNLFYYLFSVLCLIVLF